MNITDLITSIYEGLVRFVPLFRVVWAVTSVIGAAMFVMAFVLKRNPVRKKSPWIVGGIGFVLLISSGIQFVVSLF